MSNVQQAIENLQNQMYGLFETHEFFKGTESIYGHNVDGSLLTIARIARGVEVSVSNLNEETGRHEFSVRFHARRPISGGESVEIITKDINMSEISCKSERDLLGRMANHYLIASQVLQFFATGSY